MTATDELYGTNCETTINGYSCSIYCNWLKFLCKHLKGHDDVTVSFE
jgi:hypothetical protein